MNSSARTMRLKRNPSIKVLIGFL